MTVRPAKTQIILGIRPVWSESSLCAQWVAKDPSFLHADSEDSDQTGRMPRLIWVFGGRTLILLVFPLYVPAMTGRFVVLELMIGLLGDVSGVYLEDVNVTGICFFMWKLKFIFIIFIKLKFCMGMQLNQTGMQLNQTGMQLNQTAANRVSDCDGPIGTTSRLGFATRYDSNRYTQLQRPARVLKVWI